MTDLSIRTGTLQLLKHPLIDDSKMKWGQRHDKPAEWQHISYRAYDDEVHDYSEPEQALAIEWWLINMEIRVIYLTRIDEFRVGTVFNISQARDVDLQPDFMGFEPTLDEARARLLGVNPNVYKTETLQEVIASSLEKIAANRIPMSM